MVVAFYARDQSKNVQFFFLIYNELRKSDQGPLRKWSQRSFLNASSNLGISWDKEGEKVCFVPT